MTKPPENKTRSDGFLKTDGGKTRSNAIETPTVSLPKGGGAIKGIDEKFTVNAVNGTASFSVPLPFSSARGASPSLGLSYNSGGGNGIFGLGWSLGLSSIKRKTDNELPQYLDASDSDTFLFSEAEDLVPVYKKELDGSLVIGPDGDYVIDEKDSADSQFTIRSYRSRTEGLFARIERWSHKTSGEIRWRVTTKENQTTLFGWSPASRIADPKDVRRIFEWLPEFVFDDKGNCTRYIYKPEDDLGFDAALLHNKNRFTAGAITYTNLYLARVLYGNLTPYKAFGDAFPTETDFMFQTVLDYGEYNEGAPYDEINEWDFRADAFSSYKSGFEIRTTRLCKRVLLFHFFDELPGGSALVRSIDLEYDTAAEKGFTFLRSVTSRGYIKRAGGAYTSKHFPPVEFEYQEADWNTEIRTVSADNLVHSPSGLAESSYQFTDLFNEGLSGILTEQANGWYYKHNLGGGVFEQSRLVSPKPSFTGLANTLQLTDLDADGRKQITKYDSEPRGFFELNDDNQWLPFRNFDTLPNIDLKDANTRLLDLTGDGMSDMLITEDAVFTWYRSAGRDGFLPARKTVKPFDEETGPHLVFAESGQTVFLADMTGDGLTDIVRIRNGEICYWPNLGYGRFGTKVAMDNAPVLDSPTSFDPALIRLADIDGSGTADLIYLGKNKFTCWMNLSGNIFSTSPLEVDPFPEIRSQSSVTVVDLLGNGVQCIVYSSDLQKDASASLRYVDLMNGKKPHIMVGYKNNLGKEVAIEYVASTKFYIEDKLAGAPWVTKLHFPVQCVARTETRDVITGVRFASAFKYHHGYFDHAEKEFRGFGMVEQTDTEEFDHWVKSGPGQIAEQDLHQAPVVTKSWFHTGAFLGLDAILEQFAGEYWYEEMIRKGHAAVNNEVPLPDARLIAASGLDPSLIDRLSGDERREALRACKNMALRVETFARDAPLVGATPDQLKAELTPFTVVTHNCVIELIQPRGNNKHAVFIVKESEAVTYSYERRTEDPRIGHTLNIKLDEYGNVLESASVVYPRMLPEAGLPPGTSHAQGKTLISYAHNKFTGADINTVDDFRLRMPSEAKTYELKGVAKTGPLYSITDFDNVLTLAVDAEYHEVDTDPLPADAQKRLIEHKRTLFYRDDLSGPLPPNQMSANGLIFESYQLAYTPALITDIFGTKVNAAVLLEGKFTHSEGDDNWWIRSGTIQFIDGAETLADAEDRFFVPISYTDPYGARTRVEYLSNYFLVVEMTEDALQNRATVLAFNMRTLSPQRLRDANDNISEAISDELGLVKATAILGKGAEADDLAGIDEFTGPAEDALAADFLAATDSIQLNTFARDLLQHATTRFVYDVNVYHASGGLKPVVSALIVREEHFVDDPLSPLQLSFEYSNGLGQTVLKKVQAEPGPARRVTVNPDNTYTVSNVDTGALIPERLRWIGNGRTVLNNKGNAVKQYEPYFSVTPGYEDLKELVETGVTPVLYYDAVGRLIKKEFPDRTFSGTTFDSWTQNTYDQNDTVLDSAWYDDRFNRLIDAELTAAGKDPAREQVAAERAARHHGTPLRQHLDTLGRPVLQIEHCRDLADADVFYETIVDLDAEGNLRRVINARGNTVMRYKYDMLGNMVYQDGMDAGKRWIIQNVAGNPLRSWDERNHELSFEYDVLHRPVAKRVAGGDGSAPLANVYERTIYGEGLPNDKANNLRAQAVIVYDTAGKVETPLFDFKSNPLNSSRRFATAYKELADWGGADPDLELDAESFTSAFRYDVLNRVKRKTAPDGSIIETSFNEAGLLEQVQVTQNGNTEIFVRNIDYDEKRQRTRIVYGNNVTTNYFYDRETFRLKRLETKRQNNDPLQDLRYTLDPMGNITHVEDRNIPEVFFNNQKITGTQSYTYDPLYRLIEAAGREHAGQLSFGVPDNWDDLPFLKKYSQGDVMAWRNYTEQYDYDGVGNIDEMRHIAVGGNWTRTYSYAANNNRLLSTTVGPDTYSYQYHPQHGFITALPHLPVMKWNFKDELQAASRQSVINGSPETTWYVYDGAGKRTRKITENQAAEGVEPTRKSERIYVGGIEVYRDYGPGGVVDLERKTCHVMDDKTRVAMIETRTLGMDDTPPRLVRYQFANNVGSACIETDATARVISYEEYHPFGTTSYQAVDQDIRAAGKRYRYSGMERDDESGLEYHSARYYLPWLGRWLSADPADLADGPNLYRYARNNPVRLNDPRGTDPTVGQEPPVTVTPLLTQEAPVELSEGAEVHDESSSSRFASGDFTLGVGVRSAFLLQVPALQLNTTGILDATGTARFDTAAGTGSVDLRAGLVLGDPTSGLNLVAVGQGSFQISVPGRIPLGQLPGTFLAGLPGADGNFGLHGALRVGTFQLAEFQGTAALRSGQFDARLSATTFGDIGRLNVTALGSIRADGLPVLSSLSATANVTVPVLLNLTAQGTATANATGGFNLAASADVSFLGIPSLSLQGTGTASSEGVDFAGTFSGAGPLGTSYIRGDFDLSTSRGISARALVAGVTYTPTVSVTDPTPQPAGVGPSAPLTPWEPGGLTVGVSLFRYSQGNVDHISGGFMPSLGSDIVSNPRFGITGVYHF